MWLAHISFAEAGKALSPTERSYVLCKAEVADLRTRWRNTLAQHVTLFLEYRTYCGLPYFTAQYTQVKPPTCHSQQESTTPQRECWVMEAPARWWWHSHGCGLFSATTPPFAKSAATTNIDL
jgi:hypothetical protein